MTAPHPAASRPGRPWAGAWTRLVAGLAAWLLLVGALLPAAAAQDITGLRVGHWLEVKGAMGEDGVFVASSIEVVDADNEEAFVATPTDIAVDGSGFKIFGLPCVTSARTDWNGLTWSELTQQVKVQGRYRGPQRFAVRDIKRRKSPGRDRIEGRLDRITRRDGGLVIRIMHFDIRVPADVEIEADRPLETYQLIPVMPWSRQVMRDDEDEVLSSVTLSDTIILGGRLEWREEFEHEFNLDSGRRRNERDRQWTVRGQVIWEPVEDFYGLLSMEGNRQITREAGSASSHRSDGKVNEAYGYWRLPKGVDIQFGRQDFDDVREWVYDENLDGVRVIISQPNLRLELAGASIFWDGSHRDRRTDNWMLYLSNNDEDQHLAAYVIDRRTNDRRSNPNPGTSAELLQAPKDEPIFFGARIFGEWVEDYVLWADLGLVRGYRGDTDYDGWGLDVGTTYYPESLEDWYFTLGAAVTSGDEDPTDDKDTSFRQTGLNDNNGRWGGVTSFKYYGELVEPELSNLSIITGGVGVLLTKQTSLDLVAHRYRQVQPSIYLRDTNLRATPDGESPDIGWEADLILGLREYAPWEVEVIVSYFEPGKAFRASADEAYYGKIQLRYRF